MSKKRRTIAVTGTPGTGKTTFARELSKDFNFELMDLNEFVEKEGIYELDSDGTKAVSTEDLRESFEKRVMKGGRKLVVDSLLSHLLSPSQLTEIIVLRTKPEVLKKRLSERDYTEEKVRENLEAEALGAILQEAIQIHGKEKVYELDTTKLSPSEAVSLFKKALSGRESLTPGNVDWLEDFYFQES